MRGSEVFNRLPFDNPHPHIGKRKGTQFSLQKVNFVLCLCIMVLGFYDFQDRRGRGAIRFSLVCAIGSLVIMRSTPLRGNTSRLNLDENALGVMDVSAEILIGEWWGHHYTKPTVAGFANVASYGGPYWLHLYCVCAGVELAVLLVGEW